MSFLSRGFGHDPKVETYGEAMSHEVPGGDKITTKGGRIVNRTRRIAVCVACVLFMLVTGCSRKGPVSVRFTRQIDEASMARLPRLSGSVVLLVDREFWSDREKFRRIPIARREKTFIIGPGAAEMAEKMLVQMFDDVIEECCLDKVSELERYDLVIRLIHESFDDRTLFLPFFSRQRYLVDLAAEITRVDGSAVGKVEARGSESFWLMNLSAANPYKSDAGLLEKASNTLNAAVQESVFGLMDELELLLMRSGEDL